jgi:hypothetical protein
MSRRLEEQARNRCNDVGQADRIGEARFRECHGQALFATKVHDLVCFRMIRNRIKERLIIGVEPRVQLSCTPAHRKTYGYDRGNADQSLVLRRSN